MSLRMYGCFTSLVALASLCSAAPDIPLGVQQPRTARAAHAFGRLPLSFEANQGQRGSPTRYIARARGYTLFLTNRDAVMVSSSGQIVRMKLIGGSRHPAIEGVDRLPGNANYFMGNDPKRWRTGVPTYAKVRYRNVYPGVDLLYYGNDGQLEYDFLVSPGADPNVIGIDVRAQRVRMSRDGDLLTGTGSGDLRLHKPVIYQVAADGVHRPVPGRYLLRGKRLAFQVAPYDHSRPLVIDPAVSISTYLGGSGADGGDSIAVDASGDIYVAGFTTSSDFPTTSGAFQQGCGSTSCETAFVAKLNSTGSELLYSTYLGGTGQSGAGSIAIDGLGNAYVAGYTEAQDFPITPGAFQTQSNGAEEAFITKLDPTGSALIYSSYLGGSSADLASQLAVDSSGNAYLVGSTCSTDFPITAGAFQSVIGGGACNNGFLSDAFVTKVNPSGTALVYSTYLGGSHPEAGTAITVDSSGNAYVGGYTCSANFPVTPAAFQTQNHGGDCMYINVGSGFVTKLDPAGASLVYSSYLGGIAHVYGIAVNPAGNAFVAGTAYSSNFPTTPGAFKTSCGTCASLSDGFVTEFDPTGSALVYSTYLGGASSDVLNGIAVNTSGNAVVTGNTVSSDFPVTQGAFQTSCAAACSGGDAFVTELNPTGSSLVYSTFLGGSGDDAAVGITVDTSGNTYLTGYTYSTDFPVTPGAFQSLCDACSSTNSDAFILKFVPGVQVWPLALTFAAQAVGTTSPPQTLTLSNSAHAALQIAGIILNGVNPRDFAQTNNCGGSLAVGASCQISVAFAPTGPGARQAALRINDIAPNTPQTVSLTGTGTQPAVTLSPAGLTFATQVVFTRSAAQSVTVTNTGNGSLSVVQVAATGPFHETNTCTTAVAPGASCTITITFIPTKSGALVGSILISDDAPGSPQAVSLIGTGTLIQLLPTTLRLGHQPIGTTSLPKQITVSNKGSTAVNITSISIGGADPGDFAQTNTCPLMLASGSSCFISVTFTPAVGGLRTSTVSVNDDGGGSPQTVVLEGTGT